MKRVIFAVLVAMQLASCDRRHDGELHQTFVNYDETVEAAVTKAGFDRAATGLFDGLGKSQNGTGRQTVWMRLAPARFNNLYLEYELGQGYRRADARELVAFAADHPDVMPKRDSVCAPGEELARKNGGTGFPAMRGNGAIGNLRGGCRWILKVRYSPPEPSAPPAR